jgi:hypothetical protein
MTSSAAPSDGTYTGGGRRRRETFVDFTGTWDVVSSPDFDDEYLALDGGSYITLRQNGIFVKGEYSIGVQSGTLDGGAHDDFVDFHFQGADEMEDAFGEGEANLDGERLIFELWHYRGDEYTFECVRRR